MKGILLVFAFVFCTATFLPLLRDEAWWIRIFDFPRAQIAIGGLLVTILYLPFWNLNSVLEGALVAVLLFCTVFQFVQMFPYTKLARRQSLEPDGEASREDQLSILIANVLMENRQSDRLLDLIREYDPDVILTVETDAWWADKLSVLDGAYPHVVKKPLSNTYGMILQSRLELVDAEVKFLVEDSIPSIHGYLRLPSGSLIRLACLHPRPPYPKEDTDTVDRDAELLIVGKEVENDSFPTIVMGDLNDVAWSYTTSLFQRVSGLLDPRIGRGRFSSFHANIPLLRWPLDHVFHSEHFRLLTLQRLPAWGSDHFPMYIELQYAPTGADEQEPPEAGQTDEIEADEKIEKANESE